MVVFYRCVHASVSELGSRLPQVLSCLDMHPQPPPRLERDRELVRRIAHGDGAALSELVRLYTVWLLEVALPIVGSPDLAQDVVQDVFVRLWDQRTRLTIRESVAAFLYRSVRNRALDVAKHERAQHRLGTSTDTTDGVHEPSVLNAAPLSLDNADFRAALDAALARLQPRTRDIFLMRAEQEMSYEEIAAALDITVSTAYKQVYRATKELAQLLSIWKDAGEL